MMKMHYFLIIILWSSWTFGQKVIHSEMLGRPTNKSVTLRMFFDQNAEISVEYGTQSGNLISKTPWKNIPSGSAAEILIDGLNENTRYFYRVLHRIPGSQLVFTRPEYSFHTQRKKSAEFTFVIEADPHMDEQSDSAVWTRCLKNQLEDKPDFMIDMGDIIMSDKLKNAAGKITRDTIAYRCKYTRSFYEATCHSVPLFIALGNHEGEAGWTLTSNADNTAIYNTLERKKYYANPSPDGFYTGDDTEHSFVGKRENYYSWTWGDALFIVLDPYWYTSPKPDENTGWRWTLGKKQYDWLRTTLENNQSTFKFVFCHQLVGGDPNGRGGIEFADWYEWGGKNKDGSNGFSTNRPGWYKPIKDVLKENRVNVFFHGHDHFFGKQEKDCLIYQECPQPSHKSFANANQATEYGYLSGQILPNSGHLRVNVTSDQVKIEYVRAYSAANETSTRKNGDIAAIYYINKNNCYDSLSTGLPVIWKSDYLDELIYPNPFSSGTKISFSIPQPQKVNLVIRDSHGKFIKKLIDNSFMPEGRFEVFWDGTNSQGVPSPAGTYIYSFQNDKNQVLSGQILLVK